MKESIFISGVQRELAKERQALRDFVRGDALLGQYFDVFLFEDLPAMDRAPADLYMIAGCLRSELPEPDFLQDGDQFVLRLWRNWPTTEILARLDLNERQRLAITHLKVNRRIGNVEYQRLTAATRKTATRDLDDLVGKGLVERVGTTGRGVYYVLARKGDMNGTNGTSPPAHAKGDGNETKGTSGLRDTRSDRKPGAQRGRGGRTGGTVARGGRSRT